MDNTLKYPEDFNEAVQSMDFLPEELRPVLIRVFFDLMTFGIY